MQAQGHGWLRHPDRYTRAMESVADDLREEDLRSFEALTPSQRVELALRLGQRDIEFYMATNRCSREVAIAALRRATHGGRTPSRCADEP
jgi:hypothetical protein